MFSWRKLLLGLFVILIDFGVGSLLGVLMMDYDDSYNQSKGAYGSWSSMNAFQKQVSVGMQLWSVANGLVIAYLLYRVVIRRKRVRYMPH